MISRRIYTIALSSVAICFFTTVCLLLTISAQVPETSNDTRLRTLVTRLKDTNPAVRGGAAQVLGQMGENAKAAAPALIEALKDQNEYVRGCVAKALVKIGQVVVPILIEALKDQAGGVDVRGGAANVLGEIGPEAKAATMALIDTLKDGNEYLRDSAATAVVKIGPVSVPTLIAALKNPHKGVAAGAANILGWIGPKAAAAVPALIDVWEDESEYLRGSVADALVNIGPVAIPRLIEALNYQKGVRGSAAYVLGQIGPEAEAAVPALISVLKDTQEYVRSTAADALGRIRHGAEAAIPVLIENLHDTNGEARSGAAYALGEIGEEAKDAAPSLIEALRDDHEHVRASAADALVKIGPVSVSKLIEALENPHPGVSGGAARILGQIGPEAKAAGTALIKALENKHRYVRRQSASALGQIGLEANSVFPPLIEAGSDTDKDVRVRAASSLGNISATLTSAQASEAMSQLKAAYQAIQTSADSEVRKHADHIQHAIDSVLPPWWEKTMVWLWDHPYVSAPIAFYLALPLIWLLLLWQWPVGLFRISEAVLKLGRIKRPLRWALPVELSFYSDRVLDAWVTQHIKTARRVFAAKEVVEAHQVHVQVPLMLDKTILELTPKTLQTIFSMDRAFLLIQGEGGSGKTSLACDLAKWAMAEEEDKRLCRDHLMLPILIDRDSGLQDQDNQNSFVGLINAELRDLTEKPALLPNELLQRLLERRRVLVIVDGLSELNKTLRQHLLSEIKSINTNACIFTSRAEEPLGNLRKSIVRPLRIKGDLLANFIAAYLKSREKRALFENDKEFFDACGRLSELVQDREVTVLLAKLFAEQMIAIKENAAGDEWPKNIPDLMLKYINTIYHNPALDAPDIQTVQHAAKVIAWECLRITYRPAPANRKDVIRALGGDSMGRLLIEYLEKTLKLIQTIGPGQDRIRFELDPLSEYLAGLHLVSEYGNQKSLWKEFLNQAGQKEGAPESMMGFLLAVRDCCLASYTEPNVPASVLAAIAKKAGLDQDTAGEGRTALNPSIGKQEPL